MRAALTLQLYPFLKALTPELRASQLPVIVDVSMEPENWRFRCPRCCEALSSCHRHSLAQQFGSLVGMFDGDALEWDLVPALVRLLRDPVASVRNEAAKQVGAVVSRLSKVSPPALQAFTEALDDVASETTFQSRILWELKREWVD